MYESNLGISTNSRLGAPWEDPTCSHSFADCKKVLTYQSSYQESFELFFGCSLQGKAPTLLLSLFVSVHPCDKRGKAGCEHTCNKFENLKFTCSCEPAEDFELHTDGRQCIKSKFYSLINKWYKGTTSNNHYFGPFLPFLTVSYRFLSLKKKRKS